MYGKGGGPGESRTPDKRFRKPLLYPSELQALDVFYRIQVNCVESEYTQRAEFFAIQYQESVNSAARGCPTASGGGSVGSLKSAVQDQLAISGRSSKFCRI
jgi:hypothetical protein